MRLSQSDRTQLYGTAVVSEQMTTFLASRIGRSASVEVMRDIWWDISAGYFWSSLFSLKTRKHISLENDVATLLVTADEASLRDKVWAAAKLLKRFTAKDVQNLLPSAENYRGVCNILHMYEVVGALSVIGTDGTANIYQLDDESALRPSPISLTETSNRDAGMLWETWSPKGSFTAAEIVAEAVKLKRNEAWAKDLLASWIKAGLIEPAGEKYSVKRDKWKKPRYSQESGCSGTPQHLVRKVENLQRLASLESIRRYCSASVIHRNRQQIEALKESFKAEGKIGGSYGTRAC